MKRLAAFLFLLACSAPAHVGSPDVFYEGDAGPYRLLITIRPPEVVPGVAEIEIRSTTDGVREIKIVPLRLGFRTPQFTPVPDVARPSKADPRFYTGSLWLMACCSWQVRIDVDGARGPGRIAVPVPALATRTLGMQKTTGAILLVLGLVLCLGIVSIAGAAVRDAVLDAGKAPDPARIRRARWVMAGAAVLVALAVWFGGQWWGDESGKYARFVYKPLKLDASVRGDGILNLQFDNPGWLNRRTDDLLPDHDHLMHLYVLRLPAMERVWHLHPEVQADGSFAQVLPAMPAGRYALYGDVVHANGVPETATAELDLPAIPGKPLTGDDAAGDGPPLAGADRARSVSPLAGGYRMVWDRSGVALQARRANQFRFRLEDAAGRPAGDMQLYMGMLGHAAFVSTDRTVFAHVHPSGSVPMPAIQLTQPDNPHAGHTMPPPGGLPAEVTFPYGFPKAGAYRIFVQMKRAGQIVTGVFDADVAP